MGEKRKRSGWNDSRKAGHVQGQGRKAGGLGKTEKDGRRENLDSWNAGAGSGRENRKAETGNRRDGRAGAETWRDGRKAEAESRRDGRKAEAESRRDGRKAEAESRRDGRKFGAESGRDGRKAGAESRRNRPEKRDVWKENRNRQGSGRENREEIGRGRGEAKRESRQVSEKRADVPSQKQRAGKICHAFGDCGGCQLLGIPYEEQLAGKKRKLAKLLKPYVKPEGIIGMEEPEHYRNKVNAAFTHDRNGKPLSGVYKEGTHYIIPIEKCILENQKADEIIGSVRELLPSFRIKTYDEDADYGLLRHVMVRIGHATGQIMVVLVLASPVMPSKNNFVKALLKRHPEITTIVVNVNDRKTSMVLGDKEQVIYGKGYIEDVLCGLTYKISPKSFYQVNSVQAEKLYAKAMEYAGLSGRETVLDAYCGIGTIGMTAAKKAKKVIGVELNQDAVKDAVANARMNKIGNVQFYQKDAGEFMRQLAEQDEKIDVVFMDPPRNGSDEVFLDALATLKPEKVVYISCNPETLVRDLEVLVKRGYRVMRGMGCDMFPFCDHVETVTLLVRKP